MRQLDALAKVAMIANELGNDGDVGDGVSRQHINSMFMRAYEMTQAGEMSEAKLGRWLGYAQGVLVAQNVMDLEGAKELNREFAE
jgi:hypothetical protein